MKRAFTDRFCPTPERAVELSRTFGCVGLVYNKALQERSCGYALQGRKVSYVRSSAMLTQWRKTGDLSFANEVSSVPLQQGLRYLQSAFAYFFAQRARYPVLKSRKKSRASAEYTRSGFRWRAGTLTLAKMTEVLDVWSCPLPGGAEPSTVTVSREVGGWHVSLLVETVLDALAAADAAVGVDAGITSLVALSTGGKVTNPRLEDRARLAGAQRALSRKANGSNNRQKARLKVARAHARITDRRPDFMHTPITRLVGENHMVVIEDVNVRTLVADHSLGRAVSDAA